MNEGMKNNSNKTISFRIMKERVLYIPPCLALYPNITEMIM